MDLLNSFRPRVLLLAEIVANAAMGTGSQPLLGEKRGWMDGCFSAVVSVWFYLSFCIGLSCSCFEWLYGFPSLEEILEAFCMTRIVNQKAFLICSVFFFSFILGNSPPACKKCSSVSCMTTLHNLQFPLGLYQLLMGVFSKGRGYCAFLQETPPGDS